VRPASLSFPGAKKNSVPRFSCCLSRTIFAEIVKRLLSFSHYMQHALAGISDPFGNFWFITGVERQATE
jgi:hypothetical protein